MKIPIQLSHYDVQYILNKEATATLKSGDIVKCNEDGKFCFTFIHEGVDYGFSIDCVEAGRTLFYEVFDEELEIEVTFIYESSDAGTIKIVKIPPCYRGKLKKKEVPVQIDNLDSDELNQALYSIGFNITGLIVDECLHRPIFSPNNEPWYGKRYLANERQDKEWLRSGKASLENIINSNADTDHRRDLIVMSTQSNNTLEIIEHMEHKD